LTQSGHPAASKPGNRIINAATQMPGGIQRCASVSLKPLRARALPLAPTHVETGARMVSETEARSRALRAGAIGFLGKPFGDENLISCLNKALAARTH